MAHDRLKLIKEMLETNPEDSFLKYAAALEYEKEGDRKSAIAIIEDLLSKDANYLGGYYKLGNSTRGRERKRSHKDLSTRT